MDTMESVYKPAILKKATALVANEFAVQIDAEDATVWWVKGSTGSKYRVQLIEEFDEGNVSDGGPISYDRSSENYLQQDPPPETGIAWVSCTCPNGMNRGGRPTCYHTAAVLMKIEQLQAAGKTLREVRTMQDANPLNEDFLGDADVSASGYTPDEIDFLRG